MSEARQYLSRVKMLSVTNILPIGGFFKSICFCKYSNLIVA
jgi:hypothetical protein